MIDDTSLEIIRYFQWPRGESSDLQSRPSIYKISKKLGIHPLIIKKRINEMISLGLIRNISDTILMIAITHGIVISYF